MYSICSWHLFLYAIAKVQQRTHTKRSLYVLRLELRLDLLCDRSRGFGCLPFVGLQGEVGIPRNVDAVDYQQSVLQWDELSISVTFRCLVSLSLTPCLSAIGAIWDESIISPCSAVAPG